MADQFSDLTLDGKQDNSQLFCRLIPRRVSDDAYRFNDKLVLLALTQEFQHGAWVSSKINIFNHNGHSKEQHHDRGLWDHVDARIKQNQKRRLQILLIEKDTLYALCPQHLHSPQSVALPQDAEMRNAYDDLQRYAEYYYEIPLKELSLICRKDINNKIGHQSYMYNAGQDRFEFTYEAQIFGSNSKLEWLKTAYWAEDAEKGGRIGQDTRFLTARRDAVKKKQNNVKKKNHDYKTHYFRTFTDCSICGKFIWGLHKDQGYRCTKCYKAVHEHCIHRTIGVCNANPNITYVPINESQEVKANQAHALTKKTNYRFRACEHSGAYILPFMSMHKCGRCNSVFRQPDKLPKTCGINEMSMYVALKDARHKQDQRIQSTTLSEEVEVDLVYQAIGKVMVNKRGANLDGLANMNDKMANHLKIDDTTRRGINSRRTASVKRQKDKEAAENALTYDKSFEIKIVLGQGSFGKVLLGMFKKHAKGSSKHYVAIKAIRKDITVESFDVPAVHIEKDCLTYDCRFLVQAICTFQDPKYLYFVMEFYRGGDLMSLVMQQQRAMKNGPKPRPKQIMSLDTARVYGAEILLGLQYLHQKRIVYRDLKLDNVMIDNEGHCRIADFGMVKTNVTSTNLCSTFCGTPDYMAPEILQNQKYSFKVDTWSFGVCLFEMCEGFSPFQGQDEDTLFEQIKYYQPMLGYAKVINNEIKHMLVNKNSGVLAKDPKNRYSIAEVLSKPFFASLDLEAVKRGQVVGGAIPSRDYGAFISNFDSDFTRLPKSLDEPDIRAMGAEEDKVFQGFDWKTTNMNKYAKYSQ